MKKIIHSLFILFVLLNGAQQVLGAEFNKRFASEKFGNSFYIINSANDELNLRIRLPLNEPESQNDYLVFKPKEAIHKSPFSLNNEYYFTLKKGYVVRIPYNTLFKIFLSKPNWSLLVRTSLDSFKIKNAHFLGHINNAYAYKKENKAGQFTSINNEWADQFYGTRTIDFSEILWIQEGKEPRTMTLEKIMKEIENNPKYIE